MSIVYSEAYCTEYTCQKCYIGFFIEILRIDPFINHENIIIHPKNIGFTFFQFRISFLQFFLYFSLYSIYGNQARSNTMRHFMHKSMIEKAVECNILKLIFIKYNISDRHKEFFKLCFM